MRASVWTSIVLLAFAPAAFAHHSPAMFNMAARVEMTGVVKEFQWTNPHSYIQLLVKDDTGKEVEWSMEMAAPTYLYNNGWRPSTVKPGQTVTVKVSPLNSGAKGALVWEVTTADGRKLGSNKQ